MNLLDPEYCIDENHFNPTLEAVMQIPIESAHPVCDTSRRSYNLQLASDLSNLRSIPVGDGLGVAGDGDRVEGL